MNDTHKEIKQLHEQVSQLYIAVKQLSEYVGWQDISHLNLPLDSKAIMSLSPSSHQKRSYSPEHIFKQKHSEGENIYLLNQHKDVLIDDESVHTSISDNSQHSQHSEAISCEEQVHRLTAQLTAAYYRIASLEEQLLAIRNNMEIGDNSFYQCQ